MPYPLSIDLDTTGLTLTAQLISGGAVAQSVALAESATITGHYSATGAGAADGKYGVRIVDGGGVLHGSGEIEIAGDAEVVSTGDAFARLGAPAGASHAADIAAVKGTTDKLDPLIVGGAYTPAALANAPTGGGGSLTPSQEEKLTQIHQHMQV